MTETPRRHVRAGRSSANFCTLALIASALLAPLADAQNNTIEPGVRFVNLTPFARTEWGTATIPFAQGDYLPGETWRAVGVPSEVVPFGAPWPDGSYRYGKLAAELTLAPGETRILDVRETATPTANVFQFGAWTSANLQHFAVEFIANTSAGTHVAGLVPTRIVEWNETHITLLFQNRFPGTDLLYDFWLTFFSGQDHARFELRVTNSNPNSTNWTQDFDSLGFTVRGAAPMVRHALHLGVVHSVPNGYGHHTVVLNSTPDFLYDGQALEWYGDMLFLNPAVTQPDGEQRIASFLAAATTQELVGVATNWPASGAFGPLGKVPGNPPWWSDDGLWNEEIEMAEFQALVATRGTPWADRQFGLLPNAAGVGDQYDFGATNFGDIVRSTYPHRLEEIRFGAGEEVMRPVHHREVNCDIVRRANRPTWISWSGRTHWSNSMSPDRLGKPYPEPWLSQNGHGWNGKDNEHWSSLGLAVATLLTGSHSLMFEVEHDIEHYLASHTLPSQVALQTNGIGSARALGRTMLSMSWHYLCTGRDDVRARLEQRAQECVAVQYAGIPNTGGVKPTRVYPTDARAGVTGDFWMPWQEGVATIGLLANHAVTGSVVAYDFARICALSLVWNGFNMDPDPVNFRIGYAMAHQTNGVALTTTQLTDPTFVQWASSMSFGLWCLPAIRLAITDGTLTGNTALVNQATTLLQMVEAQRAPQRHGRWDRFADWDGTD